MAEYNTRCNLEQFFPVVKALSVYIDGFLSTFILYPKPAVQGPFKTGGNPAALSADTYQFTVPNAPKRRSVGTKIQGFKEISLSLAVFPNEENVFSPGFNLSIPKISEGDGPQSRENHEISMNRKS
jgi:hypothetical protein